jgi:hypothetical protein
MFGMFGPRLNTVFRSKWRALWFVASVLVGVWFTVPHHKANDPDQQKDADAVAALLQQQQPAPSDHPVDPWAKTPPQQQQH